MLTGVGVACRFLYFCIVFCILYVAVADRLPRLRKRELIFLLSFTCNYVVVLMWSLLTVLVSDFR